MDALTYPAPVADESIGTLHGPDQYGAFYELVDTESLPDGRGRARFRPMPASELDGRLGEVESLLARAGQRAGWW